MKMNTATLLSLLFAAIGVVSTAGHMLWLSRGSLDSTWALIIAWACLPSFVLAAVALAFRRQFVPGLLICIGGGLSTILSFVFYLQSFAVPDPQAGLAFLVCPLCQFGFTGVLLALALITCGMGRNFPTPPAPQTTARDSSGEQDPPNA
ncbi:MAG: hypothetical protein J0M04_16650 [Verrucomicrobia bacterium]|nr:hypothetical protein [Verrucomicrobiota bacterium]